MASESTISALHRSVVRVVARRGSGGVTVLRRRASGGFEQPRRGAAVVVGDIAHAQAHAPFVAEVEDVGDAATLREAELIEADRGAAARWRRVGAERRARAREVLL